MCIRKNPPAHNRTRTIASRRNITHLSFLKFFFTLQSHKKQNFAFALLPVGNFGPNFARITAFSTPASTYPRSRYAIRGFPEATLARNHHRHRSGSFAPRVLPCLPVLTQLGYRGSGVLGTILIIVIILWLLHVV
jgi:hypothetical protein